MVDVFLLLIAPGGGDELQGIKRGIVELADLVVVTKDDGDLAPAARRAVADYRHALRLFAPGESGEWVEAVSVSALAGKGLDKVWQIAVHRLDAARANGHFMARRAGQAQAALWREIGDGLIERFRADKSAARALRALEAKVAAGKLTPAAAARQALNAFANE
jgi:LAO/AO transport system kinase